MGTDLTDYRALFLAPRPLLDVRAPAEFRKGAFPGAVNLPLLEDDEREQVGACYVRHGPRAALELGHQLVSGERREARVAAWAAFARAHPDGALYCFRGGLRSQIAQQWLAGAGVAFPRVAGGYKALRHFLMDTTEQAVRECRLMILGGLTGTGKTDVLDTLPHALDLEQHAHHRGSAFGRHVAAQPAQIDFEHRLALDWLRRRAAGERVVVVEDEGRFIGSCSLPRPLHLEMQQAALVWLEASFEARVERILHDYVVDLCREFAERDGAREGFDAFAQRLRQSLAGIAKRLGGERTGRLSGLMEAALREQQADGNLARHQDWIVVLLREYYDPMYVFQRERKAHRIVFSGEADAVRAFLAELPAHGIAPTRKSAQNLFGGLKNQQYLE